MVVQGERFAVLILTKRPVRALRLTVRVPRPPERPRAMSIPPGSDGSILTPGPAQCNRVCDAMQDPHHRASQSRAEEAKRETEARGGGSLRRLCGMSERTETDRKRDFITLLVVLTLLGGVAIALVVASVVQDDGGYTEWLLIVAVLGVGAVLKLR